MSLQNRKHFIIYCSPAGSTRHVAQVLEDELKNKGAEVVSLDMGKEQDTVPFLQQIREAGERAIVFIGSPVYVNRPVPPIMDFIARLPKQKGAGAVPFVTWGCVSSGIALYDMGIALKEKDFFLLGAIKAGALHSMMWRSENPLGKGHPDADSDEIIRSLVRGLEEKLEKNPVPEIPLSLLCYQPPELHAEMKKMSLVIAKSHMPKRELNQSRCTQCGICAEVCPVQAISLSPWPEYADHCICCFNCVRKCPETAIVSDMSPVEERIRKRAAQLAEKPYTRIFL